MKKEESNQKPNLGKPNLKFSDRIDTNVKIVVAFFLGAILAGVLVLFALPTLVKYINELFIGFIVIIGVLVLIAFIFTIFKEFFFRLFFGISKADLEVIKESATSLLENSAKQNWKAVSKDFQIVSQKGTAWYAWISYRRWVVTVFYTLFLAFAGLLGSVLLYNQNQLLESQNKLFEFQNSKIEKQTTLLEKQNEKIDNQMQLEESSRRGNLIVMMSNIMDKVDEELKTDWRKDGVRNLSSELVGRIAALSHSFKPYRFLQDTTLTDKPYSPERGQLLVALVNMDLDNLTYNEIYSKSNFRHSLLSQSNLKKAYLDNIDLRSSSLVDADLKGASLKRANLSDADMTGIGLNNVNGSNAILERANLTKSKLQESVFIRAKFNGAIMKETFCFFTDFSFSKFKNVDLEKSNLLGSYFNNVSFYEVNFESTSLDETDFNKCVIYNSNFLKANLSGAGINGMIVNKYWLRDLSKMEIPKYTEIRKCYWVEKVIHEEDWDGDIHTETSYIVKRRENCFIGEYGICRCN